MRVFGGVVFGHWGVGLDESELIWHESFWRIRRQSVKSVVESLVEGGASGIFEIHNLQTSIMLPCIANLANQNFPCIFESRLPQKFVEPYEL